MHFFFGPVEIEREKRRESSAFFGSTIICALKKKQESGHLQQLQPIMPLPSLDDVNQSHDNVERQQDTSSTK
jgi:hypothetical protein